MAALILVVNCGSSSAKYQLFDIRARALLAKGVVERIGSPKKGTLTHEAPGGAYTAAFSCRDHYVAIKKIVETLGDRRHGAIRDTRQIGGVGHRVVHGQEEFTRSVLITKRVIASLERYSELAPLHNPPALRGIRACAELLRGVPQVAVFDTAFHHTMPPHAFLYGIPYEYYTRHAIRRYGFHGTSHRYVAGEAAKALGRPLASLRLITCHLGNGCSMAAIRGGRSVDTSMGFTPLEGLVMGTRSGDIDPAAVLYIMEKGRMGIVAANGLLNKKSGLLGLSGISNDMRDLRTAAAGGDTRARRAIDLFVYRIEKYLGAYHAVLGGVDAVIFTAGIGEHSPWLVSRIRKRMGGVLGRRVRFLVIPTDEELLIARDTYTIVRRKRHGAT